MNLHIIQIIFQQNKIEVIIGLEFSYNLSQFSSEHNLELFNLLAQKMTLICYSNAINNGDQYVN